MGRAKDQKQIISKQLIRQLISIFSVCYIYHLNNRLMNLEIIIIKLREAILYSVEYNKYGVCI